MPRQKKNPSSIMNNQGNKVAQKEIYLNEQKEYFTKEIETLKRNQIEILELKNSKKRLIMN